MVRLDQRWWYGYLQYSCLDEFFSFFFLCGLELPVSRLACSVSLTTTTTLKGRVWLYLLFGHKAYLNMCFNLSLLSEHAFQFVFCYLNMCLLSEHVFQFAFVIGTCVYYLNMCFNLPSLSEDVFVIWTSVLICFCYRNTCLLCEHVFQFAFVIGTCVCYQNMCFSLSLLSENVFVIRTCVSMCLYYLNIRFNLSFVTGLFSVIMPFLNTTGCLCKCLHIVL